MRPGKKNFLLSSKPLAKRFAIRLAKAIDGIPKSEMNWTKRPPGYWQLSITRRSKTGSVHLQYAGNGKTVVRYLARYVHRSALSDQRLKGFSPEGRVTIQWQNNKTGSLQK